MEGLAQYHQDSVVVLVCVRSKDATSRRGAWRTASPRMEGFPLQGAGCWTSGASLRSRFPKMIQESKKRNEKLAEATC